MPKVVYDYFNNLFEKDKSELRRQGIYTVSQFIVKKLYDLQEAEEGRQGESSTSRGTASRKHQTS